MIYKFPKNFLFGSSTCSPQIYNFDKGPGRVDDIWSYWYKKEPERFYQQQPVLNHSSIHYKKDIKLAKWLGYKILNTSISWSRLFPDGKRICKRALKHYNNLINEMILHGIKPILHLFHFDMPMWAQKLGGWESREVVRLFGVFAKRCFELFSDRVKIWFTFNEPIVVATCGYLLDKHYPCVKDFKRCYQVQYHLVLAHALAVKEFRKQKIKDGEIGLILNLLHPIPKTNSPEDVLAANNADHLLHICFLEPAIKGAYDNYFFELLKSKNISIKKEKGDQELIKKGIVDLIGINYYAPSRVCAPKAILNNDQLDFSSFFNLYHWPKARMNVSRGWEIYPPAIYDVLMTLKNHYNNIKCMITENGMGVEGEEKLLNEDGQVQDDYRIQFHGEHLAWVAKAVAEGSNCCGYSMWTYIDNWSWLNAYKNRYGVFRLDLKTGNRIPKKSAYWFKDIIMQKEVDVKI